MSSWDNAGVWDPRANGNGKSFQIEKLVPYRKRWLCKCGGEFSLDRESGTPNPMHGMFIHRCSNCKEFATSRFEYPLLVFLDAEDAYSNRRRG